MDDFFFVAFADSVDNLFEDIDGFVFEDFALFLDFGS